MKIGLFPFLLSLSVFISVYRGFPSCPPAILVSEFRAQFFSEIQDSPSPLPLSLSPYVDPFVELAAPDLLEQPLSLLELGQRGDLDPRQYLVREVPGWVGPRELVTPSECKHQSASEYRNGHQAEHIQCGARGVGGD